MTDYFFLPSISFILCLIFTPIIKKLAYKNGWLAYPKKERWHKKPTALLGGIAIYFGIIIPLFFIADFNSLFVFLNAALPHAEGPPLSGMIFIGISFLFFIGVVDDFIQIKPQTKLIGQILIASISAFLGLRLNWFTSMTLDTIITIIWIVGITNAFNLLDNMDGLCAGIGFIAASMLGILYFGSAPDVSVVAFILAGSLGAFLIFNSNPASIFMGDCGSLSIGYMLAILSLYNSNLAFKNPLAVYAVPILLLMIAIFDTTLVTFIRLLSGRKASVGGKDHTSHRLVLMGFSERGAVFCLYGIGAISGFSAIFVSRSDTFTSPSVIIPILISFVLMGIYMAQIRVYPEKEFTVLKGKSYTPILVDLTFRKHIVLVVLDFALISFTYYLSYRLRFDSHAFGIYFPIFLRSLPAVIVCKFIAFFLMGIYSGFWQFMSSNDIFSYLKGSTLATLLIVAMVSFVFRFENFSKGIFVIDWFLTSGFLLGTRGSFRLFTDTIKRKTLMGANVLIYGAGRGGELLLRELLNNQKLKLKPIGFIDDDPIKKGKKIQGYPILGGVTEMDALVEKHDINGILISSHKMIQDNLLKTKSACLHNELFLKKFSIALEDMDVEAV